MEEDEDEVEEGEEEEEEEEENGSESFEEAADAQHLGNTQQNPRSVFCQELIDFLELPAEVRHQEVVRTLAQASRYQEVVRTLAQARRDHNDMMVHLRAWNAARAGRDEPEAETRARNNILSTLEMIG